MNAIDWLYPQPTAPSVLDQLSNIDSINELITALTNAGFSYASSGASYGGAILSETWTHSVYGAFSFSYEYGSDTVSREEDYSTPNGWECIEGGFEAA